MSYTSQRGVATLLITSILLTVALVVTLGMYKNLFFKSSARRTRSEPSSNFGWRKVDWNVSTV